jgi:putative transposase
VLHLASILDCFSRRIVGRQTGPVADSELVAGALGRAVAQRRPGDGLVHLQPALTAGSYDHRNNTALQRPVEPAQYTALAFGSSCRLAAVQQSYSAKGSPHDNAVQESFFATLEKELLRRRSFDTHAQARSAIFVYIEGWYNPRRLHSTLGYRSPDEAERDYHQRAA